MVYASVLVGAPACSQTNNARTYVYMVAGTAGLGECVPLGVLQMMLMIELRKVEVMDLLSLVTTFCMLVCRLVVDRRTTCCTCDSHKL